VATSFCNRNKGEKNRIRELSYIGYTLSFAVLLTRSYSFVLAVTDETAFPPKHL